MLAKAAALRKKEALVPEEIHLRAKEEEEEMRLRAKKEQLELETDLTVASARLKVYESLEDVQSSAANPSETRGKPRVATQQRTQDEA